MEIFQDNLVASLAMGAVVGLVLAALTWAWLQKTKLTPGLRRLLTGLDFAIFGGIVAYLLYVGL